MIVLNFAHPLTGEQLGQIEAFTGRRPERVIEVSSQIDPDGPLAPQIAKLADACCLSACAWQTLSILVNPPSLNFSAAALIAELHGRMGHFPTIVRLRPVPDSAPLHFEVGEIIDLQRLRDDARRSRDAS
jgi:hypothetical protein